MEQSIAKRLSQVHEDSIRHLGTGRIPTFATERLQALRGAASPLFITTLSADEFAFARASGLRPFSQVMGACVYQRQEPDWRRLPDSGQAQWVERETWSTPRNMAVHRMSLEAQACGAHVVTGVRIRRHHWEGDALPGTAAHQFVATGTAMLRAGAGAASKDGPAPVLTTLSAQDHWKLVQHGFDPLGVVACTIWVRRQPSAATRKSLNWDDLAAAEPRNREAPELSALIKNAYANAMIELRTQARPLGAAGILGLQIDRSQYTDEQYHRVVMVDAIGTALASRRSADSADARTVPPVLPVRRLDREGGNRGEQES